MAIPTFHAIVVVDIESFGPRTNPFQASLRRAMYDVVREACAETGISWESLVVLDRGDGVILLVPPATSVVTIAGSFVRALDAVLKEKAAMFSDAHRMRFRVALHQGLCQRDDNGWVGEAINTTCRLIDAQPLRDVLKAAPEAHMALIVSDEIYQNVISHEYRLIDAASFAPVVLSIKELAGEKAWISVPGRPHPPGLVDVAPSGPPTQRRSPPAPAGQSGGIANYGDTTVHGDQVAGDKFERPR
jgi:hypothetical protein